MLRTRPALCVALLLLAAVVPGREAAAQAVSERPRVGLVLSGGGARGFAHIGVLRALRELNVPVDIVVGTSMGCVVGGAFAAGRSVEELEAVVRDTDWRGVLADRAPRDTLSFRRREEDLELPSRVEFGLDRRGLSLPPAAAGNAELERALGRLLPEGLRDQPANALPLPFRSVASDLLTGELVELSDTPLFLAMRASLSLPGVFAPVRVKQRLLVDGGLVRNLPVDIARALGADIVIAVNVGTPLADERELGTALGVAQQMLRILTEQNVQQSVKELGPSDILIAPQMGGLSFLDFTAHAQAIQAGADATRALADRLRPLALPPAQFAERERLRQAAAGQSTVAKPIAGIQIEGTRQLNPELLKAELDLREGQEATPEQVRQAASRLYRHADIDRVETRLTDAEGRRRVTIEVSEADWARSRLRLGLELSSDFSDSNSFGVVAMHIAPSLNDWGAELRTIARLGTRRSLSSEWWQPLGVGSDWFIAPTLAYEASAADAFANGLRTARVGIQEARATLALGRQLADWGDLRVGVTRTAQRGRLLVPADPTIEARFAGSSRFLQLRVDTLEPIAYPVRGQLLQAIWTQTLGYRPEGLPARTSQIVSLAAFSLGDWGGHVYGEWAKATSGFAPSTLGGFLRLSGTDPQSVSGQTVVFGRVLLARRIGELPPPFGAAIRAGFSLEAGDGFAPDRSLRADRLKQAGSAFLALDTRFGPLYLGTGATLGSTGTVYLFLGPVW